MEGYFSEVSMLALMGISDGWVSAAYVLCLASAALCIVYGAINWNRGATEVKQEDIRWAEEEKKVEKEL